MQTHSQTPKSDTTVMKVQSESSPRGKLGQKYLATGKHVAMRLWDEQSYRKKDGEASRRDYETVGYVIDGSAELHLEGQTITLQKGDSWLVPPGASHSYRNLSSFVAVEATSPPAQVHGRDE